MKIVYQVPLKDIFIDHKWRDEHDIPSRVVSFGVFDEYTVIADIGDNEDAAIYLSLRFKVVSIKR
jgi:hypothetical protein